MCETIQCPDLLCENPITNSKRCCPECPPGVDIVTFCLSLHLSDVCVCVVCNYEGDVYEDDSSWTSKSDPCVQCICRVSY